MAHSFQNEYQTLKPKLDSVQIYMIRKKSVRNVLFFRVYILQLDITKEKEIEAATYVVSEKVGDEGKFLHLP